MLQKIDIVSWESEAFKQASREFGVRSIPYTRVYNKKGEFVAEISGGNLQAIEDAIRRAE